MSQFQFRNLLRKYLNGQATENEIRLIGRWYDRLNENVADQFTEQEQARLKARMWQQIEHKTTEPSPAEPPIIPLPVTQPTQVDWWRNTGFWRMAAAALVVLVGGWYGWTTYQQQQQTAFRGELAQLSAALTERRNTTQEPVTLTLPDGSQISLMPRSAVRYPQVFAADKRDIYLTGDAFFSISKDVHRPFRVFSEKVVTQVLGTSFWIKAADQSDHVEVEVRTGKVAVYKRPALAAQDQSAQIQPAKVVLTPNQKVTVDARNESWRTGLVARPLVIKTDEAQPVSDVSFEFSETPLSTVLSRLSVAYGIDITATNQAIKTCTFSGDISRLPFYTQLDLICKAVGASYDVQGTRIQIQGRGCTD